MNDQVAVSLDVQATASMWFKRHLANGHAPYAALKLLVEDLRNNDLLGDFYNFQVNAAGDDVVFTDMTSAFEPKPAVQEGKRNLHEVIRDVLACVRSWEPDARLMGNVQAQEIERVAAFAADQLDKVMQRIRTAYVAGIETQLQKETRELADKTPSKVSDLEWAAYKDVRDAPVGGGSGEFEKALAQRIAERTLLAETPALRLEMDTTFCPQCSHCKAIEERTHAHVARVCDLLDDLKMPVKPLTEAQRRHVAELAKNLNKLEARVRTKNVTMGCSVPSAPCPECSPLPAPEVVRSPLFITPLGALVVLEERTREGVSEENRKRILELLKELPPEQARHSAVMTIRARVT